MIGDETARAAPEHTVFEPGPAPRAPATPVHAASFPARAQHAWTAGTDAPQDEDLPQAPPPAARPHNPMLLAATPLLAIAASVRSGRVDIDLRALHRGVAAEAARFDAGLAAGGYDEEARRRARYAVFATIDDVAQNLPGKVAESAEWARRSMIVRAFGENIGGDRFWQLLGEMLSRPAEHLDLIELYHACLAAGFEGRYRLGDPQGKLRATQRGAYAALTRVRSISETELVPAWRGTATARTNIGPWAPATLAVALTVAALMLVVLGLRLTLIVTGEPSMAALLALNPDVPLRLSRAAAALPATPSVQQRRLQAFLADEIAQKLVAVERDPNNVRVRTTAGTLFRSGSDALAPGSEALFRRIAEAADREKGPIRIEGHADGDRVASLTFPDNVALSQARAERVAEIFRERLADPGRATAHGFGSSRPIGSNATPEGKALNRRVEIVIPRNE